MGARAWAVTVGGNGSTMTYVGYSARSVIREAYELGSMPIVGAPQWLDRETFDITAPGDVAVVDGRPDYEQVRGALREFLEGSLGLTTHRETRTFPAYAMVLARTDGRLGASLKPSTTDCIPGGPPGGPNLGAARVGPVLRERQLTRRMCGIDNNLFGLTGARVTMTDLARDFDRQDSPLSPGREIIDKTGLTGDYDFELRFGVLPLAAIGQAHYRLGRVFELFGVRSVFTALPEQLGLKLVDTTVSRNVLVIDQINRPLP
jgi:uncharacterized protein (TIGR03435 family)